MTEARKLAAHKSRYELSEKLAALPSFYADYDIIVESSEAGAWSFICRDERLLERISSYYGRSSKDAVLKIWQYPFPTSNIADVNWGRYFDMRAATFIDIRKQGALLPALKAQNFAAKLGLAPAIYGFFSFESSRGALHPAILCQDAKTMQNTAGTDETRLSALRAFCKQYGIDPPFFDLERGTNFVNGVYVDWQHASLGPEHLEFLQKHYLENTQFGESKYQTAPAIGVDVGIRDTAKRISDLGLDRFEFNGASLLDIGCNGGQFLNYAAARGLRFGCGVDWPKVATAAAYVSNYLGHFNIKYMGAALHQELPKEVLAAGPFDLVLLLSMTTHIGTPNYLHSLGKRLIVEVNHPHQIAEVEAKLEPHWWIMQHGKATDHGDRKIIHCFSRRYYTDPPLHAIVGAGE